MTPLALAEQCNQSEAATLLRTFKPKKKETGCLTCCTKPRAQ